MSKPKMVLFGGSFDPPHNGHRALIRRTVAMGYRDIMVIPAAVQPLKGDVHAPAFHRFALCALAFSQHPEVRLSSEELTRTGPSFMVDTVTALRSKGLWPKNQRPWLLLGQDSLVDLPRWKSVKKLASLVDLLIASRSETAETPALVKSLWSRRMRELPGRNHRATSTDLRRRCRQGLPLQGLTPAAVATYLKKHKLYV